MEQIGDVEHQADLYPFLKEDPIARLGNLSGETKGVYLDLPVIRPGAWYQPEDGLGDHPKLLEANAGQPIGEGSYAFTPEYAVPPAQVHELRHKGLQLIRELSKENPDWFKENYGEETYNLVNADNEEHVTELFDNPDYEWTKPDGSKYSIGETISEFSPERIHDQRRWNKKAISGLQKAAEDLMESRGMVKPVEVEERSWLGKLFSGEDYKRKFAEGGLVDKQMNFAFMNEGGMMDDGQTVEPTTGNEIPPGSLSEEVADTVDAKLSEGEYVLPADVVQYYGLQKIEGMVNKAKKDLGELEAKDRIKGPAEEDDDLPFSDEELLTEDGAEEPAFAEGGMVSPYGQNPASQGPSFETVIYVGPDGSEMPILFMGGQPVQQIPQGYVRKDQAKASGTFRSSRAATKPDDNYQPESRGKPVSEWDLEDFEKYANSQQMMDVATKLPAIMGPFGALAGRAMDKMYQFQGAQALEEIDRRMQGELDAASKERLAAVKTQIEENQKSGGLFGEGEDSFLGQLVKGENPLEKLFGAKKPTTTSGEMGRGSSAPRSTQTVQKDDSPQAPKTSPRPQANPTTVNKAVQETQKKQATVSSGTGSDKTIHSFEDNDPRSKGFADGGFVRRRQ